MKIKTIIGATTVLVLVGGTIYAIKKYKKQKAEEITVEEAMELAKAKKEEREYFDYSNMPGVNISQNLIDDGYFVKKEDAYDRTPYTSGEFHEDIQDEVSYNLSFHSQYVNEELEKYPTKPLEKVEEEGIFKDVDLDRPLAEYWTEEDKKLRYEPSSKDALNQFVKFELAEWAPMEPVYQAMLKLFDFPYNPENDGDYDLKTALIDYRVQFFGFGSKWTQQITFADVILHYARLAQYNNDETIRYWVEYFLEFLPFDYTTASHNIDEVIDSLNKHNYFNEETGTFGLFGLDQEGVENAMHTANRNIDRRVTYDIEFNEFLKSCL